MRFKGLTALVTGASSGIGEALALELAGQGASVALCARRRDRLEALVARIAAAGGRGVAIVCDVRNETEVREALRRAVEAFGRLDVVVANAGFGVVGRIEDLRAEDFRRQLETNFYGVLHTVHAAIPELKKTRGRIAIVGSVSSYVSAPEVAPYSVSKYAVRALAEALDFELRKDGISTTLVAPGYIESEIRQVGNDGELDPARADPVPKWLVLPAEAAARVIVRAVWRRKREVVVTWSGKLIVFLQRHAPGLTRVLVRRLFGDSAKAALGAKR